MAITLIQMLFSQQKSNQLCLGHPSYGITPTQTHARTHARTHTHTLFLFNLSIFQSSQSSC